ncbi:MAG TPA: AraC family ligand binding domain-containing protein, partial [Chloroflexota bacterium]|nr:AraC family ligand binding domain-containing protein [Chloroflexota bacterium]
FDLAAEIAQLHREEAWRRGDHNAITLVKEPDLRLVLVALKDGGRLPRHQTAARIAIQTLDGAVRVQLPDRTVDLPRGHLLTLEANIPHEVEGRGESAFLLTVSWQGKAPPDAPGSA